MSPVMGIIPNDNPIIIPITYLNNKQKQANYYFVGSLSPLITSKTSLMKLFLLIYNLVHKLIT